VCATANTENTRSPNASATFTNLLQLGGVSQYWTWRGDSAATAGVGESAQYAPVLDAFGDLVNGSPDVYA
jgi:hypothetical protein